MLLLSNCALYSKKPQRRQNSLFSDKSNGLCLNFLRKRPFLLTLKMQTNAKNDSV